MTATALKALAPSRSFVMSLPRGLARRVLAEATRRGVRPNVLVGFVMSRVLDDKLLDAVLDGDDLAALAPVYVQMVNGLTRLQCGVLLVIAENSDEFGIAFIAAEGIARAVPCSQNGVEHALCVLQKRGLVTLAAGGGPRTARRWQITEDGWPVAKALAGEGA